MKTYSWPLSPPSLEWAHGPFSCSETNNLSSIYPFICAFHPFLALVPGKADLSNCTNGLLAFLCISMSSGSGKDLQAIGIQKAVIALILHKLISTPGLLPLGRVPIWFKTLPSRHWGKPVNSRNVRELYSLTRFSSLLPVFKKEKHQAHDGVTCPQQQTKT